MQNLINRFGERFFSAAAFSKSNGVKQLHFHRLKQRLCRSNGVSCSFTSSLNKEKGQKVGIFVFSTIVAGTAGLGLWQTKRYFEKQDEIQERKKMLAQPPCPLPEKASIDSLFCDANKRQDFILFTMEGTFLHDQEIFVGPRSAPAKVYGPAAGLASNPTGYTVWTPLRRSDGSIVIVNRGWVPRNQLDLFSRPKESVGISGVIAKKDKKLRFTPDNTPGSKTLFWIDYEEITRRLEPLLCGNKPLLIEQVGDYNGILEITSKKESVWPCSKELTDFEEFYVMPLTHAMYAATWYSLACFGAVATWVRFRKKANIIVRNKS